MGVLTNNILTIIEPTIELDTFDIPDIESGNQSGSTTNDRNKSNNPNASRVAGGNYPAIRINEYDFNHNDIVFFNLDIGGSFLPELRVSVEDSKGVFNLSQYPKDGDTLSLYIRSADEEVYKSIRMDFDILNVDAPPVSDQSQSAPADNESDPTIDPVVFSFECRVKIPGIFKEVCKSYGSNTLFNHLIDVADELKIGFASNVEDTDDEMSRIIAYDTIFKFITNNTKTSYKSDNHFFMSFIDAYYYLNFVDINNQLKYDNNMEETLVSLTDSLNDQSKYTDAETIGEGKLFLSNLQKGLQGTTRYVGAHSLQNNAAEVTLQNGYKKVLQYYDVNDTLYRQFDINPLISEDLPADLYPLRGRSDENRFKEEIKFKYLGKQSSNTHENYLFAQLHNHQNMMELDKLYMTVELETANMALYTMQKIPILIYETSEKRVNALNQREEKNRDSGQPRSNDLSDVGDTEGLAYGSPKLNQFLTGTYVIGQIEYIYSRGNASIKQKLKLFRREWPQVI